MITVIDDFKSGEHATPPVLRGKDRQIKDGSMAGGKRLVNFIIPETNVFGQVGSFQVRPIDGVMVVSTGYKVFHRVEMGYGIVDLDGHVDPLHLDLSNFDRFEVDFDGCDLGVNFNIVLSSVDGSSASMGINVTPSIYPFTVEFPFTHFVHHMGELDFGDLSVIVLVFQSGSAIGSNDYAVTEIRAAGP